MKVYPLPKPIAPPPLNKILVDLKAAGEFLNERLFLHDEDNVVDMRTKRGKARLPNTPLIRDLVQFFIESELHEHGAYLVDSLIESNEMMKVIIFFDSINDKACESKKLFHGNYRNATCSDRRGVAREKKNSNKNFKHHIYTLKHL